MTTTNGRTTNMDNIMLSDDTIAVEALDAAVAAIQKTLGQTDGGFAALYFSGDTGDAILRLLQDYIAAERAHLDGGA